MSKKPKKETEEEKKTAAGHTEKGYFSHAISHSITDDAAFDWLMRVEDIVARHQGIIFGGYCRDFLAYRREVFEKYNNCASVQTPSVFHLQLMDLIQQELSPVLPNVLIESILFPYLEDVSGLAQYHDFKDMDVRFPGIDIVKAFVASLEHVGATITIAHVTRLLMRQNHLDNLSLHQLLDRSEPILPNSLTKYVCGCRVQIMVSPTTLPTLRLFVDMNWPPVVPVPIERGMDFHCNRLRYHPATKGFSVAPCLESLEDVVEFVDGNNEDLYWENSAKQAELINVQHYTLQEIFKQVYQRTALATNGCLWLLNTHAHDYSSLRYISQMKLARMHRTLGFSVPNVSDECRSYGK